MTTNKKLRKCPECKGKKRTKLLGEWIVCPRCDGAGTVYE